MKSESFNL